MSPASTYPSFELEGGGGGGAALRQGHHFLISFFSLFFGLSPAQVLVGLMALSFLVSSLSLHNNLYAS